jgi:hypothetical protein
MSDIAQVIVNNQGTLTGQDDLSTLASSTLIILFSQMLKFSKIISSKSKNIVKKNSEYLEIFHFLKRMLQN